MFTRSGERDAGELISDLSQTGFTTSDLSLTQAGFDNMKLIGAQVKEKWAYRNDNDEKDYWLDWADPYDKHDVFIYAGSKDRMNDSAIRFADGLFGDTTRTFPITDTLSQATAPPYDGSAYPLPADDFLTLSSPTDSCVRLKEVNFQIANNEANIALKEKITDYLEDKYFPELRKLVDNEDLKAETLYSYANYIDWARKSGDPI